ncbi:cytochrome b/b6 domain-containing protein [Paenarthrobacter sp. NPDC089316]|uniref:cytochrome b/b6 domain-containing protein n=1 Tax=unclassified Paenarthrobacter TaxID=2634190 RepID=UPI00344A4E5B
MTDLNMRRGLPRVAGGNPWPSAGLLGPLGTEPASAAQGGIRAAAKPTSTGTPAASADAGAPPVARRGLPRIAGGEPRPPAAPAAATDLALPVLSEAPAVAAPAHVSGSTFVLRRGLPRVAGHEPWPQEGLTATDATDVKSVSAAASADATIVAANAAQPAGGPSGRLVATENGESATEGTPSRAMSMAGGNAYGVPESGSRRQRESRRSLSRPARIVIAALAAGIVAATGILLVKFLLGTEALRDFLTTYPGEYHLPDGAPIGVPPWLGWQHFFNVFLMVLIIRSGLGVRTEKRPTVFFSARRPGATKISLTLWLHQSLDVLWLVNGAVFVILLFATGQWVRIVPTSWQVFPNALSAFLQYASLNWPTENGWVNYNSLQQLAYFTTVFMAAPLAGVTGFRMSGFWPRSSERLSKAFPVEWARAVHFPVMLYFVAFIALHVTLVFATGVLTNLNHMYASQDGVSWTGFWTFVTSVVIIAAAWLAARPLLLVPIARIFGKVTGR